MVASRRGGSLTLMPAMVAIKGGEGYSGDDGCDDAGAVSIDRPVADGDQGEERYDDEVDPVNLKSLPQSHPESVRTDTE